MQQEKMITLGEFSKLPRHVHVLLGVVVALLVGIYFFFPAYPTATGKSLAGWTWAACNSVNGFLHGRLVPLIFPWMIWWAWQQRKNEVIKPSCWGLLGIGVALVLFWISMRIVSPRWALTGAPFLVIGLAHYLFGWRIAKVVIFPAFFLWFAIPVPGLIDQIDPRRIWLTSLTFNVGQFLGMDLSRNGSLIEVVGRQVSFSEG